jgi:hypothetical protein
MVSAPASASIRPFGQRFPWRTGRLNLAFGFFSAGASQTVQPVSSNPPPPMSVKRARVGSPIGRLDDATLLAVTRSLAVFLGIA